MVNVFNSVIKADKTTIDLFGHGSVVTGISVLV
jgi:hypothetical protein